jgi:ribose 5-phosphate isomerase B
MKIAVACDHGALNLKKAVIAYVESLGHEVVDFGTYTKDSCDYPDYAAPAAEAVASGECERGIVVCSSGIGVSIVANKVPGVRCAHCHDTYCAKYTRLHNDANMIAMGEKVVGEGLMQEIVNLFLNTPFEGGERHERRVAKIKALEEKYGASK